jgi:hypothetical protein
MQLKPETIADLKQGIESEFGLFGSLHLKHTEDKCPCDVCAAIRKVIAEQSPSSDPAPAA